MGSSKKPALIFIHGFRGNPSGLKEIAEEFKNYKILIPDIPPFGNSKPLEEYSTEAYVNFIVNYIDENNLEKPILIGHSMGSVIVSAVAAKFPKKINGKLILLSPMSKKPNKLITNLQPLVAFLPNDFIGWLCSIYLYAPRKNLKLFKKVLNLTYAAGRKYTSRKDVAASAKFSSSIAASDFTFNKDVLFIVGEKENLVPKKSTENFAKKVHAKIVYIKNSGHLLNYESPKEVSKAIRDFLNQ